ncbi:MAG: orotate phosphoribosyltransferase [Chloroflexi bacterium]|nr:orotate phosphoribosyltransferase [Chloroflexota bacterium]
MSSDVQRTFEEAGAIAHGHFLLTSGLHSPVYWEKFRVLESPVHTVRLCSMIADHFRGQGIQVVAGPTTGGMLLAFEAARQMGIRAAYAEKDGNARVFKRGHGIKPGERTLIIDDVLTTGSSVASVIQAVQNSEGRIMGIGVLVDRSEKGLEFGYPLYSCLRSPAVTYPPEECPLCRQEIPLARLGGA